MAISNANVFDVVASFLDFVSFFSSATMAAYGTATNEKRPQLILILFICWKIVAWKICRKRLVFMAVGTFF